VPRDAQQRCPRDAPPRAACVPVNARRASRQQREERGAPAPQRCAARVTCQHAEFYVRAAPPAPCARYRLRPSERARRCSRRFARGVPRGGTANVPAEANAAPANRWLPAATYRGATRRTAPKMDMPSKMSSPATRKRRKCDVTRSRMQRRAIFDGAFYASVRACARGEVYSFPRHDACVGPRGVL